MDYKSISLDGIAGAFFIEGYVNPSNTMIEKVCDLVHQRDQFIRVDMFPKPDMKKKSYLEREFYRSDKETRKVVLAAVQAVLIAHGNQSTHV